MNVIPRGSLIAFAFQSAQSSSLKLWNKEECTHRHVPCFRPHNISKVISRQGPWRYACFYWRVSVFAELLTWTSNCRPYIYCVCYAIVWLTGDQWQKVYQQEGTVHHPQAITTFNLTLKVSSYQATFSPLCFHSSKGHLIFGIVDLLTSSMMLDFVLKWQMCYTNNTPACKNPVKWRRRILFTVCEETDKQQVTTAPFGSDISPVIDLQFPSAAQINSKVDIGPQIIPEEQRKEKENKMIHLTRTEQTNAFDRPISGLNSSFCIQGTSGLWEV